MAALDENPAVDIQNKEQKTERILIKVKKKQSVIQKKQSQICF